MPAVNLAGEPVGFKTYLELRAAASKKARDLKITFSANGKTATPRLSEIGVSVNAEKTADKAFSARRLGDMPGALAMWQAQNVPLTVSVDEQKLEKYLNKAFPEQFQAPEEPTLRYDAAQGAFAIVTGKNGQGFDIEKLEQRILSKSANSGTLNFTTKDEPIEPNVSEAAALEALAETEEKLLLRLELRYFEKIIYFPEPQQIAAWLTFSPTESGELEINYDRAKIRKFIQNDVTASLNQLFGPGTDQPHSSDTVLQITEVDALTTDIVYALRSAESFSKEIEAVPKQTQ